MSRKGVLIFTDGGTINNGQSNQRSFIAVWQGKKGRLICEKDIGDKTNNEAEYIALITALEWAKGKNIRRAIFKTDSQLIKKQIGFEWGVRASHLTFYRDKARKLLMEIDGLLRWVSREENMAGIYLEEKYRV